MPDGHEVVPLFRELPDKGLEDVGNTLAIFFDCPIGGHINGSIGVASVPSQGAVESRMPG